MTSTVANKPHILLILPFNLFRVSGCPQRHLHRILLLLSLSLILITYGLFTDHNFTICEYFPFPQSCFGGPLRAQTAGKSFRRIKQQLFSIMRRCIFLRHSLSSLQDVALQQHQIKNQFQPKPIQLILWKNMIVKLLKTSRRRLITDPPESSACEEGDVSVSEPAPGV